ncbi:hypothetical protein I4F81_008829 [Pyropia yezoensis]|uniref:Uncharacterized protein n=1 Tax=Pyropia yezoensis TaxID=2788 RepID=A0ACC3C855_PYRYE|nr:hypothetical protein I4F81_008829 [Neopyropia yezoensis]
MAWLRAPGRSSPLTTPCSLTPPPHDKNSPTKGPGSSCTFDRLLQVLLLCLFAAGVALAWHEGLGGLARLQPRLAMATTAGWAGGHRRRGGGGPGEVDVAYFVQVSESNLPLLPRLLRSIHHPANTYAVHFDKKIPAAAFTPVRDAILADPRMDNVLFMSREVVTYRGISTVLNVLSAMEYLLSADRRWTYFINISASDYPLVPPTAQRRLLAMPGVADAGANFASVSSRKAYVARVTNDRIGNLFVDSSLAFQGNETLVLPMRQANPLYDTAAWTARKSEAWMVLHRDFVVYTVRSAAPQRLLLAFAQSISASEHYFVTLLTNAARWRRTLVPVHLRYIAWAHRGVKALQHPYYVDGLEPNSTAYAFASELDASAAFFARKFRVPDSPLLDTLDRSHSGIQPPATAGEAAAVSAAAERVRTRLAAALATARRDVEAWEGRLAAAAAAGVAPDKEDRTPLDPEEGEGGGAR